MATSGSVDFGQIASEIITSALEVCGALQIGETASNEDAELGRKHLNLMLKTWGTDPKLFIRVEGSVTLSASTSSYTASPVSLARRVTAARRRTSSIDTPLSVFSRQEYLDTPNKTQSGTPVGVYFDPQRATRTLYVWPVPDATIAASTTIRIDYDRVIEDIDSLANDPDVPQEWLEAMTYSLAARLCLPLGVMTANPAQAAKIEERAGQLYAQLQADSEEDASVFMQPA